MLSSKKASKLCSTLCFYSLTTLRMSCQTTLDKFFSGKPSSHDDVDTTHTDKIIQPTATFHDELLNNITDRTWRTFFKAEANKEYFLKLCDRIADDYEDKEIYPPKEHIMRAFCSPHFDDIKVVIIGQDPYHNKHQANGFCFAVNEDVTPPPSLKNIFGSIRKTGKSVAVSPKERTLEDWAEQGVFLLNTLLTVDGKKKALSHRGYGWEKFTDAALEFLGKHKTDIVWLLMGRHAQTKAKYAQKENVIMCAHPSPFSAHLFFPSAPFDKVNERLLDLGKDPIEWVKEN